MSVEAVEARWTIWPGENGEWRYPVMHLRTGADIDALIEANSDPAADVIILTHPDHVSYVEHDGEQLLKTSSDVFALVKDGYGYLSYQDATVPKSYSVGEPDSPGFESADEEFPPGSGLPLDAFKAAIEQFMRTGHQPTITWQVDDSLPE
jgi:immunity protein Imm1 of predicted polymorphic toxin system